MKILNFEGLVLVLCALLFLLVPQEARPSQEVQNFIGAPTAGQRLLSHNDNSEIILANSPEQYKLRMLLKKHKKIYFEKSLEQDLFYFLSPTKKVNRQLSSEEVDRFNKFLKELFLYHFN